MIGRMPDAWSRYLESHADRYLQELIDLARIPSVSTIAERRPDVRRAADWVAARLRAAGLEHVEVIDTPGHPVVCADHLHAPGCPTVMVYGHYDVQPPDPVGQWTTPPFEPAIRDGRLYARGASDMKGNLLLPVIACEALLRTGGALPLNVKFLYEGEEEIGSPSLAGVVSARARALACDLVISADSGQVSEQQPGLLVGLRGLCALQVDVRTAGVDVHSGLLGGVAPNAAHELVRLLATLRDADERILVPGFYDDVRPIGAAERKALAQLPDDIVQRLAAAGIAHPVGEAGFTSLERNWVRPTLDLVGMWSGFEGDGVKTVIPCQAHAKITCRLVPDQVPGRIARLVESHLIGCAKDGVDVHVTQFPGSAMPYRIPSDHPALAAAARVLEADYGHRPIEVRVGGSVPATAILHERLGVDTLPFGFALLDERMHAPDEFFRLTSFTRGQRLFCRLFEALAGMAPRRA
jgi:acetylornithine deacetylase/succinyl-diaminopimelate desuccinylase-like protein